MGFLTSRTIAPTVTTNDLVHIVITGDTSQGNPSGSSYKATIGQIGLAIGTGNTITISGGTDISVTGSHPNFGISFTGTTGGDYLPLSGGTVSGETIFTSGITANTISTTTIGTSGNCVDDIYVYNIHSCSPLNINPLNEGNIYFGQTSGITIDVTNNRLGINNPTPTYPLDILGNGNSGSFYYTPSSAGGLTFLSGTTTTPTNSIVRYGVSTPSYLSKPTASMTFGIRGWGDSTYNAYGNNGDGFIRASVEMNGLSFIKAQGSGTSDYIRFFAGSNPTLTPNLMINGTGATQGFVGINTSTPSERLHVSGNTLISGNLTVSGVTANTISATTINVTNLTGITANTETLVISNTPTTDPTNNNVLVRNTATGIIGLKDFTHYNFGLYVQTGDSATVVNTIVETTILDGGIGSLSIPANYFTPGDSFNVKIGGIVSANNGDVITIKIKSGSVILGTDTITFTNSTTNRPWDFNCDFTIRTIGAPTVASIVANGVFTYSVGSDVYGGSFNTLNNTTFDTTNPNTLDFTITWGTASAGNSIYSSMCILKKTF